MNNLTILQNLLSVVIDADKQLTQGLALYKFQSLFDGSFLIDSIDLNTEHGDLIYTAVNAKTKSVAGKYIIFARSSLQALIADLEQKEAKEQELEKEHDSLAIDSTCITVAQNDKSIIVSRNDKEVQLQLNDMPKRLGRPSTGKALSSAERSKRARDKKKANNIVTVNCVLTANGSKLYNSLISKGYDLNSILLLADKQLISDAKHVAERQHKT